MKSHRLRIVYFATACISLAALVSIIPSLEKPDTVRTAHIIFSVDVSKSGAAERPLGSKNRIERSKEIIRDICDTFPDIHTALYAFTHITRSHAYFSQFNSNRHNCGYIQKTLENVLSVESVSGSGSNIAGALSISASSFPEDAKARILVLFTDGEYTNNDKEFVQALSDIKNQNVLLLIEGVGEERGAFIPIYDEDSGKIIDVERTDSKKIVTALRPDTLKTIAREVDGKYFKESEREKFISEIGANLVEVKEPVKNFYSSWKLLPLTTFLLASLFFFRSIT